MRIRSWTLSICITLITPLTAATTFRLTFNAVTATTTAHPAQASTDVPGLGLIALLQVISRAPVRAAPTQLANASLPLQELALAVVHAQRALLSQDALGREAPAT